MDSGENNITRIIKMAMRLGFENDITGAEDADDAPGLQEEGAGAQHCQLPQRGAEEQVQAGVARRPKRHQAARGWRLLMRRQRSCVDAKVSCF